MTKSYFVGLLSVFVLTLVACGQDGENETPIELGNVEWTRDLDKAKTLSAETGKPLFVQFQEVPG